MRFMLLLPGFVFSFAVAAETSIYRVLPASPDADDTIIAQIFGTALCEATLSTTVVDAVVRTTILFYDCIGGPAGFDTIYQTQFGPLPAGAYTYEVYSGDRGGAAPTLADSRAIAVSPAPGSVAAVPTLNPLTLFLLSTILVVVALASLRGI
jgi:hypothetical protein